MCMDPGTCPYVFLHIADTIPVLDNLPARRDITYCHLVPLGDFFQGSHLFPGGNLYLVSRLYRPQRHNHIVIVINLYEILHNAALIPFVLISSRYSATLSASPAT